MSIIVVGGGARQSEVCLGEPAARLMSRRAAISRIFPEAPQKAFRSRQSSDEKGAVSCRGKTNPSPNGMAWAGRATASAPQRASAQFLLPVSLPDSDCRMQPPTALGRAPCGYLYTRASEKRTAFSMSRRYRYLKPSER